jgi:hypothetical protein
MIALTHRQTTWDIRMKCYKIREFMENTLGVVLANESLIALLCFTYPERYHRFIQLIQQGMNFTKFCRSLRASSWDLVLLRLPWMLLSFDMLQSTTISFAGCLSYICTTEHALRDLMSFQKLYMVLELSPEEGGHKPIIGYDLSTVQEIIGKDLMNEIIQDDHQWGHKMILNRTARQMLSSDKLALVIDALEKGIGTYCKPGI